MEKYRQLSLLVLSIMALTFYNCSAQESVKRVSNDEFSEALKLNGIQLVDIRTPKEIAGGYIKGALMINFYDDNFNVEISKLDKTKPIAVYCASGGRSAKTGKILKKLGFTSIYDLAEGFKGWERAGFPITK